MTRPRGCLVVFCIGLGLGAKAAPAAAVPGIGVREEWRQNVLGVGIGVTGLIVEDVDGTPGQEVVSSGFEGYGAPYFYILKAVGASYRQDWASDEFPQGISVLRAAQLDADPQLELLVGSGGQILVYDGATHQLERTIKTAAAELRDLRVADVDSDGQLELVLCDAQALYVYDAATGAQEYVGPGYGGSELGVGNVDDDPGLEIVVGTAGMGPDPTGYVLDGQTHALEWANPQGFGYRFSLGDVDGDGRQEVVSVDSSAVVVYDVELQSAAATVPAYSSVVQVADVEGDGPLEIIYGDAGFGGVHVLNGQTLLEKWYVPNPTAGESATELTVGDSDGDGVAEILWGTGYSTTAPDTLVVADSATHMVEWQSTDITGPFNFAHGDVDGDGQPEILVGCYQSDSAYAGGLWFAYDAGSHALEYQSGPVEPFGFTGLWHLASANVDGDSQQEVFVNSSDGYDARLLAFDGLTHAQQWTASGPHGQTFASLVVADVDLDGALEVVAATVGEPHVDVFDAATGALKWESPELSPFADALSALRVANVDGDPNPEIVVAGTNGGHVWVIDGVSHAIDDLGAHNLRALDTPDRNGDGVHEIVVGTYESDTQGDIKVLSPTGTVVETVASFGGPIGGLQVLDVTGDGVADYVLSREDEVLIRDGATGATDWASGKLRYGPFPFVGIDDSLRVADVDQDGKLEILVSLGPEGFREYEIASPRDLSVTIDDSQDPVLVGDSVVFTVTAANASAQAADETVVTTVLGQNLGFVSSSPGPPTCMAAGQSVTCDLGSLGGGATTTVILTTQATAIGTATTQASISANAPDPAPLNNVDSETTTVTQSVEADLAMGVDDGQFVSVPGQALTYTLTVANLGPWPVTAVNVIDTIPAALLGPVFSPSVGTYDPGTGDWTGLDLAAGSSVQMTLDGTLDPAATGLLTNPAVVAPPAGVLDVVPANNDAVDTDVVGGRLQELEHGASLVQPQWVAGQAFYRIRQQQYSSYEVVVDGTTGDVAGGSALLLDRVARDLDTVISSSLPLGTGFSRSLRWENLAGLVVDDEVVRVSSTGCGPACGPDDAYRVRAYDTTGTISRFNNSASQITVIVLENNTGFPVRGTLWFWNPSGTLLWTYGFLNLPTRASVVLNTTTIPGLVGQSGTITVSHDAGYGGLQGKAVAVEPATGFTFDTPLTWRPR